MNKIRSIHPIQIEIILGITKLSNTPAAPTPEFRRANVIWHFGL